jgi:hypothetical protein
MATETKEEREQRERKEQQERQRQQQEREQKEREKNVPPGQKKTGDKSGEGEQDKVGEPMRPEDLANEFRAPDVKPLGSCYGEDMTQHAGVVTAEQLQELPPETHPQKPSKLVAREEEEEEVLIRR